MNDGHNHTVIDAIERPRRAQGTVRRRWLIGPTSGRGRRLVLTVARPPRSVADRPGAPGELV